MFLYDLLRAELNEQVRSKPDEQGIVDRARQEIGGDKIKQCPKGEQFQQGMDTSIQEQAPYEFKTQSEFFKCS